MSARSWFWPGVWAATAARIHTIPSPRAAPSSAPSSAVEQAHARDHQRAPQPEADPLEAAREDRAGEQRADQAERGSVRRGGSLREQKRTQAGAEERSEREAAERQHAHDEALPEAERGEDGRERDNEPVELRHLSCSTGSLTENHTQRLRRARPVIALASVAFAIGAIVGASQAPPRRTRSPQRLRRAPGPAGDYASMYSDIDAASAATSIGRRVRQRLPASADDRHRDAACASRASHGTSPGAWSRFPVRVHTRLFGTLSLDFDLRIGRTAAKAPASPGRARSPSPACAAGERLSRRTTLPRRATLLARDGSVLAESPAGSRRDESAGLDPQLAARRTARRGGRDGRPDPRRAGSANSKRRASRRRARRA